MFLFFSLIYNIYGNFNYDIIWGYGFSYNFSKGLILYKDFNLLVTPFYPILVGTLMTIFGNTYLIFNIINSFIITATIYIIYKLNKNLTFIIFFFALTVSCPSYNLLCLLFVFLLMYLEKIECNNYLFGIVLGLCFLTKSSVGLCLCIPTIFSKDLKKISKRIVGFLIPNLIIVKWFYFNKSLYDYINYAFLGLFDFASSNTHINIYFIITIAIILIIFIL